MGENSQQHTFARSLAVNADGARVPMERAGPELRRRPPNGVCFSPERRRELCCTTSWDPCSSGNCSLAALVPEGGSFRARLIGWAEVSAHPDRGCHERYRRTPTVTRRLNELFADPAPGESPGDRLDGGGRGVLRAPPRRRAEPGRGTHRPDPRRLSADRRRPRTGAGVRGGGPSRRPRHRPPAAGAATAASIPTRSPSSAAASTP